MRQWKDWFQIVNEFKSKKHSKILITIMVIGILVIGFHQKTKGLELNSINEQNMQSQEDVYETISSSYYYQPYFTATPTELYTYKIPRKVRGIYLSGESAGNAERLDTYISLLEETELNSFIIDVKNDHGLMTYKSTIPIVEEIGANKNPRIYDIKGLLYQLQTKHIYPIARIVVFKDPYLPGVRQELAIKRTNGDIWRDPRGVMWVDPYKQEVWDYTIEIAKEAAQLGFKEIQFDYVRFPENGRLLDQQAVFPEKNDRTKAEVINQFLEHARTELEPYNVYLSADVFGLTTSVSDDMNIGQHWDGIAEIVDYICPMIYPSHYGEGNYGLSNPNAEPYQTVYRALQDGIKKNNKIIEAGGKPAIIRPWLQDFTMKGIVYGPEEIVAQIRAGEDLGIDEYIMWNAANRYTEAAWRQLRK